MGAQPRVAAATTSAAPLNHWAQRAKVMPGRVLVQFRQTPAAARIAMAQARSPLAGLRLHRLVGKRQGVPGRGSGALVAAAAAANSGTASASVPADSVMLFNITDGSSVEEKVAQLLNHAGAHHGVAGGGACMRPGPVVCLLLRISAVAAAEVAMVQPDYVRYLAVAPPPPPTAWVPSGVGRAMVPNDVFFGTYSSHWHLSQISAPVAWDTTTGSKQVHTMPAVPHCCRCHG